MFTFNNTVENVVFNADVLPTPLAEVPRYNIKVTHAAQSLRTIDTVILEIGDSQHTVNDKVTTVCRIEMPSTQLRALGMDLLDVSDVVAGRAEFFKDTYLEFSNICKHILGGTSNYLHVMLIDTIDDNVMVQFTTGVQDGSGTRVPVYSSDYIEMSPSTELLNVYIGECLGYNYTNKDSRPKVIVEIDDQITKSFKETESEEEV